MSATIELLPSPHDRLDALATAVRWWTTRLGEVFTADRYEVVAVADVEHPGHRRLPRSVSIILPPEEMFLSRVALPPGGPEAHRKALALRLGELAPLDPEALEIAAHRVGAESAAAATGGDSKAAAVYVLAMARAERLAALEAAAHRRGARRVSFQGPGDDGPAVTTAQARRARRRAGVTDMALVAALAVAGIAAVGATTRALEHETEALLAADQDVRRAAVAQERAVREAELADGLVARGVLERRAGVVLEDLAALNAATPDGAWWTRARWAPGEVTIAGASDEATTAIEGLSAAASGWSVALAGSVRAGAGEGAQTFELRLTRREAGDER